MFTNLEKYLQNLYEVGLKQQAMLRKPKHKIGPGERTIFTLHKRIGTSKYIPAGPIGRKKGISQ